MSPVTSWRQSCQHCQSQDKEPLLSINTRRHQVFRYNPGEVMGDGFTRRGSNPPAPPLTPKFRHRLKTLLHHLYGTSQRSA